MLFYQINAELQELNCKYNELETAIEDQRHVSEDITAGEDSLNHRISVLEEEVTYLKDINNELRVHINKVVEELNCVVVWLNSKYIVEN